MQQQGYSTMHNLNTQESEKLEYGFILCSRGVFYLYCFGSLGDLIISLSPTLSSPPPPPPPAPASPAARHSSRDTGCASSAEAPAWTEPEESDAGAFLDLFVCGILGRDDETLALRADSKARP